MNTERAGAAGSYRPSRRRAHLSLWLNSCQRTDYSLALNVVLIYVFYLFFHDRPSPMKKQTGFTLIELMVTVSILATVLAIGVPSFRSLIENNRIRSVTNDLVAALQFARSEAVKRGIPVTLCSSSDQASCSGAWINGWVSRDASVAADPPFRVWPAARDGVAIVVPGTVVFNALGGVANARCFTLTLGTLNRFVGVSASGRVASSTTACP